MASCIQWLDRSSTWLLSSYRNAARIGRGRGNQSWMADQSFVKHHQGLGVVSFVRPLGRPFPPKTSNFADYYDLSCVVPSYHPVTGIASSWRATMHRAGHANVAWSRVPTSLRGLLASTLGPRPAQNEQSRDALSMAAVAADRLWPVCWLLHPRTHTMLQLHMLPMMACCNIAPRVCGHGSMRYEPLGKTGWKVGRGSRPTQFLPSLDPQPLNGPWVWND
jgi:hypothetical protein